MSINTTQRSTRKRNRGLLSCIECHRRKQKCDRGHPCNDCRERGVAGKCKYLIPTVANTTGDPQKLAISRLRRIATGEEVAFTPESVQELARSSSIVTAPQYDMHKDPELGDQIAQIIQLGLADLPVMFQPFLPKRHKSPTVSSGLTYGLRYGSIGGLDPFSILPEIASEPVPKQLLIRYYIERLAPWMAYLDDNFNDEQPQLAWLPFALKHRAFFHATLLTAAVHLNRKRPFRDPSAMIWFKVETIKLANENMNIPGQAATDEMIMVAMILLYFNVGGANVEEYEVHLNGIHQMLNVRGGVHNTGMKGMVRNWIRNCHGPWNEDWVSTHHLFPHLE